MTQIIKKNINQINAAANGKELAVSEGQMDLLANNVKGAYQKYQTHLNDITATNAVPTMEPPKVEVVEEQKTIVEPINETPIIEPIAPPVMESPIVIEPSVIEPVVPEAVTAPSAPIEVPPVIENEPVKEPDIISAPTSLEPTIEPAGVIIEEKPTEFDEMAQKLQAATDSYIQKIEAAGLEFKEIIMNYQAELKKISDIEQRDKQSREKHEQATELLKNVQEAEKIAEITRKNHEAMSNQMASQNMNEGLPQLDNPALKRTFVA